MYGKVSMLNLHTILYITAKAFDISVCDIVYYSKTQRTNKNVVVCNYCLIFWNRFTVDLWIQILDFHSSINISHFTVSDISTFIHCIVCTTVK